MAQESVATLPCDLSQLTEPLPSRFPFDVRKDIKEKCAHDQIQEGELEKHKDADGDNEDHADGDDEVHVKINKMKCYEENHCNDEKYDSGLELEL